MDCGYRQLPSPCLAAADDVETPLPRGRVFTVGHSTHDLAELVRLLRTAGVTAVADVRAHPGSRRLPHFSRASLERQPELCQFPFGGIRPSLGIS